MRHSVLLLVCGTLLLLGCEPSTPDQDAPASGITTEPPAAQVGPVEVRGVEPCSRVPVVSDAGRATRGRLPAITLPCLTGGPAVTLSELGGRPTILNLWATWCGPCREEMPILQNGYERYGDRVEFVGVNTKDTPTEAAAFLEKVGVTYPQLFDVDGKLLSHVGIPGLPITLVLDTQGQVAQQHVGPLTRDGLSRLVQPVLDAS